MAAVAQDRPFLTFDEQDEPTRQLIRRVISGYGGEQALRSLTSVQRIARITEMTPEGPKQIDILGAYFFPSNYFLKVRSSKGDSTAIVVNTNGHVFKADSAVKGAAMRMTDEEVQSFYRFVYEDPLMVLQNRIRPSLLFAQGSTAKLGDREVDILKVQARGISMDWWVDRASGKVVRNVVGESVHEFSDWREVNGLSVPFTQTNQLAGGARTHVTYRQFELHPKVNQDKLFREPTLWLSRYPFFGNRPTGGGYGPTVYFVFIEWE